jgi:ribosomal protein S18 acetylase RimI-like enzyme
MITTRVANTGDFPAVIPLLRQLRLRQQQVDAALYQLHPDAERRFLRWVGAVGEDPRSILLVAEERGQTIAFLYAVVERDLPIYLHDEFAVIREWWVDPAFRRRGAGRGLIDLAIKELAAVDVRQLRVRTAAGDADARALLGAYGFRAGTCEMVKDLQPADETSEEEP